MRDGLYQVTRPYLCAGFVVRGGKPVKSLCAPILHRKITYWMSIAVWIED